MKDRYEWVNINGHRSGGDIAQTWYKEHIRMDDGEHYYDTNKALTEGSSRSG